MIEEARSDSIAATDEGEGAKALYSALSPPADDDAAGWQRAHAELVDRFNAQADDLADAWDKHVDLLDRLESAEADRKQLYEAVQFALSDHGTYNDLIDRLTSALSGDQG